MGSKAAAQWSAFAWSGPRPGAGYHARAFEAVASGGAEEHFASFGVTPEQAAAGLAEGSLVVDTRLREVLSSLADGAGAGGRVTPGGFALAVEGPLRFATPSVVDEARYAAELAGLREADILRARRSLDELAVRLDAIEAAPTVRARRRAADLVRRLRGRGRAPGGETRLG
jgi:hypothetical protein